MKLSDYDLLQLTEEELLELPEEILRRLSVKLLIDLKEARERLRQTSRNSSRPPSSDAPWRGTGDKNNPEDTLQDNPNTEKETESNGDEDDEPVKKKSEKTSPKPPDPGQRKPGKQPGAQGYGREQKIPVTSVQAHYPCACALCEKTLTPDRAKAYTAFETVDVEWAVPTHPGLRLTNTKHVYYEIACDNCGHCTRQSPHQQVADVLTPTIYLSEWRLVGPGLAALIICLTYRMRLSRARIQEFLHDWLGLAISIGTLQATLHESGAALLPVEEELIEAVQNSGLLHVDETSWPQLNHLLWLWVFSGQDVVAYWIASRGAELLETVLDNEFKGWLMSDGWHVYRRYPQRLRCWAHLLRKATGLQESLDPTAKQFGTETLWLLNTLIEAIYIARGQPPNQKLNIAHQQALADYQSRCEVMSAAVHDKTRALAREMLNDWDAIFQVLAYPHLPITNNEAERALRHWVILRNNSHGTRTDDGSRIFAILISVIETCRLRQQFPWVYLAEVIRLRRSGYPVPKLPVALNHRV
ncbi:MAG: IS66 family transposase [Methylococcaceae bacterium]|nr:MAG: IS66 family transposase [Methylococcaceae bacterium]